MKKLIQTKESIKLNYEYEKLELSIKTSDFIVYNTSNKEIIIKFNKEIPHYEAIHNVKRYTRPDTLIILGILDFFLEDGMEVYQTYRSSQEELKVKETVITEEIVFFFGGKDYSNDLKRLLNAYKENKGVLATVLDKLRKGSNLLKHGEGANELHNESFLIYFGVLELLADQYAKRI